MHRRKHRRKIDDILTKAEGMLQLALCREKNKCKIRMLLRCSEEIGWPHFEPFATALYKESCMQHFTNIIDALRTTLLKLECNCCFIYRGKSAISPKETHITQLEKGFTFLILELISMRLCFQENHFDSTHPHTPSKTTPKSRETGARDEPSSILFPDNTPQSAVAKATRPCFNRHNCLTW